MAVDADPVILEVALNGATARERNPHVPATCDEARATLGVPAG